MIMSRYLTRDTFETIVPNPNMKLKLIVEKSFAGVNPIIQDVIDDHKTRRDDWVYCMGIGFPCSPPFDDDFPGFPLPGPPPGIISPPDCPGRQVKIGGVCQDPGPTPPQDSDPPPPKPIVPPSPDPDPNDTCGLFTPSDSGCLKFDMDAIRTIQMKSTDILAHYVDLGGPSDSMVDSMTSQCGDRHPSGIASDDACLFTLGVAKNFQIDIAVSSSGDCATRDAADQSSIQKYLDAGGSIVDTQINSVTVTTTTGDGNANCIGDLKKVLGYDVEVTIPEGFYVSHDGALGHAGRPQKHRLSYGWIKGGTYFLDSPAFKTKATSNQYLTNLKLGRSIEGFHGLGEFRYDDRHPNYYLVTGGKGINTYDIDGQRIYYSGSPLSDSYPYDGYVVEGLGTASSPLKVNWVPFSNRRTLDPRIFTNVYGSAKGVTLRDIHKYDDRSQHNTPQKITVSQKGTLIVRIDDSVGPNKTISAFQSWIGDRGNNSTRNYGVNVTSSPTKKHFVGEYKSVPFDFSYTMNYTIAGAGNVTGAGSMAFTSYFCNPIAISGYEIYATPTYFGY
jgi:hypothetical protein